ncbi:phytochrome-like protein cph2 [mine drainage metagenome]|uniref:Phytochrome-like protein cph2 n=1 Tax=mine drainage metagenome TaxID=410659 RepID=A0A1J5QA49_9ZZZZ
MVEDVANISKVLSGCRDALGVSIALDDFGTGYSSLTHLRHLPANMIKIDQTFVRDMLDDPDDYAIIEGVIGLADAFRREVIAEGVETAEHGLLLLNMGCVLAQGYGIARPMPATELPAWIKHYRPYPEWQVHIQHPPSGRAAFELSLKLEIHQWVRRMDDSLNAPVDVEPRWPIMNPTRCHCGRWTMRAKRESFYSDHRLGRFIQAHERMHHIGHQLMMLFLQGKSVNALAGLPELQTAHEEMLRILAEID